MRKRKRRPGNTSSKRKVNLLKVVLITGVVLIVGMVVILLVAKSNLNSWLKGDGFRDYLTEKSSSILKSDVTLGATKWDGSEVYAEGFSSRGYEDAALSRLDLDSVRASYGGAKDGAFFIPEVKINRMNLEFSPHRKKGNFPAEIKTAGEQKKEQLPAWILTWLPNRVEIEEIRIDAGNLEIKDSAGKEKVSLRSVRTEVLPNFKIGQWEIKGQGGNLRVENQPVMDLKNMALRWKGKNLFLNQFALGIFKDGHIDGLGEISFGNGPPDLDLELKLSRIDVHDLMKEEQWKKRLSGNLRGTIQVLGKPETLRKEGTIYLEEGLLKDLPILDTIASYTRSDRFKRLALNQAHSDFSREGDRLELRKLVVQSDGLLRIEGEIDIVGEQLKGNLRVGVVPGTLRWIPGAERSVFTESKDGFLWTGMKLAGTTKKPEEDLSGRLILAAGEAILKDLPEETLNQAKKLLSGQKGTGTTTGTAGEVIDQGKKIINLLSPLLLGQ